MSTSNADGFRTRQALSDLRFLIASASDEARARIVTGIREDWLAPADAASAIAALAEGRALETDLREAVLLGLRKAAALPKDDFQAFVLASMVLLADALAAPDAEDTFSWEWQSLRDYYRVAAAVERAAIVQAIRRLGFLSGETDNLPRSVPDRATAPTAALRPLLESHRPRGLAPPERTHVSGISVLLLDAFDDIDAAEEAARLWVEIGHDLVASGPPEVLAGFRHIYEIRDGWSPASAQPIPVLDPPPGVDWPR